MHPNKKIISATVAAVIFIIISALCWHYLHHWYCFFIPILIVYLIEWGYRIYKLKVYYPPLFGKLFHKLEKEISTTADQLPVATILITSISKWMVADMIQCRCYKNYESIGSGTTEQMEAAYNDLISQYHATRKDPDMQGYIKLMRQIYALQLHIALVTSNIEILKERYSEAAARALRLLPPNYLYTEDSHLQDMEMQARGLIRSNIDLELLCAERDKRESRNSNSAAQTPEDMENNILRTLLDINKHENGKYGAATMTVREFALAENRLQAYIEDLKDQAHRNGRSNK